MRLRHLLAPALMLLSHEATAGSVSSGGGKFIGTELNPWFLENVSNVTYCVDVDEAAFRPGRRGAQAVVRYAIDKWKQTFSGRMITDPYYMPGELGPYSDVRLTTQTFAEVPCSDGAAIDLRFQFGRLTAEQQAELPNFKDYIGVAVRTSYDLATLSGKGFIYVAADAGPNRPEDPDFATDPWSPDQGSILKTVVLHELGHVFGLKHESGREHIMSEGLIDMIVTQAFAQVVRDNPGMLDEWTLGYLKVFNYDPNMKITECGVHSAERMRRLLHISDDQQCFRLEFSHNGTGDKKLRIKVSSAASENGPFVHEGVITSLEGFQGSARPIIEVKISSEQRVFDRLPPEIWGSRLYAGYEQVTERKFTGTYVTDAGETVENLFGFIDANGTFQLGAYVNGKIELNIYHY